LKKDHQITVIIADDHTLVRKGIISLLSCSKEVKIIGEAANGEELITLCNQLLPDVLLVDISMPVLSGLEAVELILDSGVKVKALFISMYYDDHTIDCCKTAGGVGLLSKGIILSVLIETIKRVYSDSYYFGKNCVEDNDIKHVESYEDYKEFTKDVDIAVLSAREQEVVILISQGLTSQQIADKLFLGKRTIDAYRCSILKKLRLNSFPELMKYAVRQHPDKYK
jgi:two-component system, NarL family, response regulator NreC